MRNVLYQLLDFIIILFFMLFGMTIANLHDYEIWHGALVD